MPCFQRTGCFDISTEESPIPIYVIATDEERFMAKEVYTYLQHQNKETRRSIPIAISARHIHLTQEAVEILFGPGHQLQVYKEISQPGQYACVEKLNIIGPKNRIDGVRVLGPTRPGIQVEVSRTDEFRLGLDAPIRNSGDIKKFCTHYTRRPGWYIGYQRRSHLCKTSHSYAYR